MFYTYEIIGLLAQRQKMKDSNSSSQSNINCTGSQAPIPALMQWGPGDAWTCSEELWALETQIFDKRAATKSALERDKFHYYPGKQANLPSTLEKDTISIL